MRLPPRVADELASRVVQRCVYEGVLDGVPPPDWERFHAERDRVRASFRVPETTITPLMARVLYGIARGARPRRLLGLGTYAGNALVWLALPGFGPLRTYDGARAVGVDVDGDATALAAANFERLGAQRVECVAIDARDVDTLNEEWDLVLLDIDDPQRRKEPYLELLDRVYPTLAPGALVLAHDVAVPLFREQLEAYGAAVRERDRFAASVTLEIDPCGLEISRKRAAVPAKVAL